jgi:phospholipid/cholesterol/gamma-HCH transport system ATP-binding protein
MIAFRGLTKSFEGRPVLRGVDLEVRAGEAMFIVGTSGVGKSVTIKHVVGLLRPNAGEVWFGGRRVDQLDERAFYEVRRRCAMVFQSSTLFDSMTLAENVALPLRKHRRLSERAALAEARRRLAEVHLEELASAYPAELGDGTRKRAAIARALTLAPECVLFDEPTTGLDPVSARRIDRLIVELRGRGVTAVVVSHDLTSIFGVADRIALLYRGVVHVVGAPDELRRSADPVVQQFLAGRSDGPMETPGF